MLSGNSGKLYCKEFPKTLWVIRTIISEEGCILYIGYTEVYIPETSTSDSALS